MELTNLDEFKEWRLETTGAELHSFLQRCAYLFEHPAGGPTRPIVFSDSHAQIVSLLTGAVIDILRKSRSASTMRVLESTCPDDSAVVLTLAVSVFDGRGSPGFSLLTRASQFCEVRYEKDLARIVARFTGMSLRAMLNNAPSAQPTG